MFGQTLFWQWLWMLLWMRLTFELVEWVKKMALPNVSGLKLSVGSLRTTRRMALPQGRGNECLLPDAFLKLKHQLSLGLKLAGFQTGTYTTGSWTFGLQTRTRSLSSELASFPFATWRLLKSNTAEDQTWNSASGADKPVLIIQGKLNLACFPKQVEFNTSENHKQNLTCPPKLIWANHF